MSVATTSATGRRDGRSKWRLASFPEGGEIARTAVTAQSVNDRQATTAEAIARIASRQEHKMALVPPPSSLSSLLLQPQVANSHTSNC
jgi:hypothetical protein